MRKFTLVSLGLALALPSSAQPGGQSYRLAITRQDCADAAALPAKGASDQPVSIDIGGFGRLLRKARAEELGLCTEGGPSAGGE